MTVKTAEITNADLLKVLAQMTEQFTTLKAELAEVKAGKTSKTRTVKAKAEPKPLSVGVEIVPTVDSETWRIIAKLGKGEEASPVNGNDRKMAFSCSTYKLRGWDLNEKQTLFAARILSKVFDNKLLKNVKKPSDFGGKLSQ